MDFDRKTTKRTIATTQVKMAIAFFGHRDRCQARMRRSNDVTYYGGSPTAIVPTPGVDGSSLLDLIIIFAADQ